jgi:alpha-1,2-mannosyltransferase
VILDRRLAAKWQERQRTIRGVSLRYMLLPCIATIFQFVKLWSVSEFGRLDFRIYYEAVDTNSSASLYNFKYKILGLGFTYPPLTALLLRPLTLLGLVTAERIWFTVSLALFVWFAHRCARLLPHTNDLVKSLACAFIIVSMPVTLTLRFGQINAVIGALLMVDLLLAMRPASRLSGVGLGLAAAIKVTPAYLGLVFGAAGRLRHAIVAGTTAIVATLAAAAVLPGSSKDYWTSVLYDTDRVGNVNTKFNNSLRRIVSWLHLSDGASTAIWIVVSIIVTVVVISKVRKSFAADNLLAAYTVASIGGYLVSPISWGHHLLFLGPAVALVVGDGRSWQRWLCALPAAFVVLDPLEGGEGNWLSAGRIVFMVLVVAFLPLDSPHGAAATTPPTRRWSSAAARYKTMAMRSSAR